MSESISDNGKRPIGRPKVGAILIGVRVPPADVAALDAWIKKHAAGLSRPKAIRRLVDIGLKADQVRAAADRAAARSKERKQ
jgi:hypothetical protein